MKQDNDEREKTESYTMRIPSLLRADLEQISREDDRSLNKEIVYILRKFVEARKAAAQD